MDKNRPTLVFHVFQLSNRELMLATSAKAPFSANGWLFELKYDGFRLLILKDHKTVRLLTRNGNDLGDRFPEIVAAVQALKGDLAIDGELVVADERDTPALTNYADVPLPSRLQQFTNWQASIPRKLWHRHPCI